MFSIKPFYMRYLPLFFAGVCFIAISTLTGCGSDDGNSSTQVASDPTDSSGLTADELENGIGPVRTVELNEIDPALVEEGKALFKTKCSACHKIVERYIGPPLQNILEKRTAPYVMNMILNPEEMTQRHPEAKALLAEYIAPMANQSLTEVEARAILEYLRTNEP